jgi:SAM-dependent methyltransferase
VYSVWDYRAMLDDAVRVDAYARALAAQVRPDDVVLDLGCGIGTFAVRAALLGARRVFGVDPNPCVEFAPSVARANGVADRVAFWRAALDRVDLPERPTLVVGDVRGTLPFHAGAVEAWNAARARMAPGARTIPRRDTVYATPVRSETLHRRARSLDDLGGVSVRCLERSLCQREVLRASDEAPQGEARPLLAVDYGQSLDPGAWRGAVDFTAGADWVVDGFLLGFEADLGEGVSYRSFGPNAAVAYSTCLLLAPERLRPSAGSRLRLRVRVLDEGEALHLLWAVDLGDAVGDWQGHLLGDPASLDVLRAASPGHVPPPDPADDLDAHLLLAFSRGASVGEAAASAVAALPGTDAARATERAAALSQRREERVPRRFEAS